MPKVVLGISGGVDSAVAAYLLQQQKHEVIAVFMRNWDSTLNNDLLGNPNAQSEVCPEEKDFRDAQKVCQQLGVEIKRVDFVKEYYENVFQDMVQKYQNGKTPNPDVLCNKYIKFGLFHEWIKRTVKEFDYIATGHYAQIRNKELYKPLDKTKDQTYFLAQVNKKKFEKTLFPLAHLTKNQVREIAQRQKLAVANKKDSTGICFIGERKFTDFLQNYIPNQPGNIVDIHTRKTVGKHIGVMYYTVGQRHGLNLGGLKTPYYVVGNNLRQKILYVCSRNENKYLYSDQAYITDVNWICGAFDKSNVKVKFRYKSEEIKCELEVKGSKVIVKHEPFKAVTPGQQAVFYEGDKCLGGGTIDKVFSKGSLKEYV